MNDRIVFGQYINADSWIHRLDPRTKIVTLFMMMIGVFFIENLYALLCLLGFIFIIVLTSKIKLSKFLQSFRMIAMLLLFTAVFQIVFNTMGDIIKIGNFEFAFDFNLNITNLITGVVLLVAYFLSGKVIRRNRVLLLLLTLILIMLGQYYIKGISIVNYNVSIHEGGLETALLVLFRVLNLISLSALLTFTTKTTDLNSGIEGIFAPFKFMKKGVSIMAMMISIALRFIPTLLNESQKILKAQASRGVDFNDGSFKDKVVQIVSLLVPMFVISYKKAEDLANAMEARAYIPGEDRTKIYELKYKTADVLTYTFLILFLGSIITLKVVGLI